MTSVVTLYGRHGCHLCEEAKTALLEICRRGARFELEEVDIEGDEQLHRTMLELIPVIDVNGRRVCELIFDEDAVLAGLDTVSA
ncbi:MAG: glutaredoxin family protein [Solirubrobacterales bacterium]